MTASGEARMTPIPGRPGWYLSSVNRHQDEGIVSTEVALTYFADNGTGQGETLTFSLDGIQPRVVIIDAAVGQIDNWAKR